MLNAFLSIINIKGYIMKNVIITLFLFLGLSFSFLHAESPGYILAKHLAMQDYDAYSNGEGPKYGIFNEAEFKDSFYSVKTNNNSEKVVSNLEMILENASRDPDNFEGPYYL